MRTFKDFLVWYNNLDVGPFVTAVSRLQKFYFDRDIDIFKTTVSVPGIARQMLFDTARREGAEFLLFDENNRICYLCLTEIDLSQSRVVCCNKSQSRL